MHNSDKFHLWGKCPANGWEVIDSAESMAEMRYLLKEYRLAFGPLWSFEIKKASRCIFSDVRGREVNYV